MEDDELSPPSLVPAAAATASTASSPHAQKPFPVIALMSLATIMRQMIPHIKNEAQYISLGAIVRYLEKLRSNAAECDRLGYAPISDALMEKIITEQQQQQKSQQQQQQQQQQQDTSGGFKMELYTGPLTVGDVSNMFDDNHIALVGSILFSGKDAFMNSPHIVTHCEFLRLFMAAAASKRSNNGNK
jgi:hypothetical protein